MEFSEDIKNLLEERFPGKDIYSMSKEELIKFREDVEDLRHEYSLLELGNKTLGNAAYGSCGNEHFYFYRPTLAADITGECRNLTKTMWNDLEHFFHETLWERKDIQEKFGFELDESMHDWYRSQPVSIYSDTDSLIGKSFLSIKLNQKLERNITIKTTIESLFELSYNTFGLEDITQNNQEIVKCDKLVLNWTKENELQYVPIKYIMRHKVSKPKFKIKTKSGKEIIVTGDHSCIAFRNGEQLTIKAKDIDISTDKVLSIIDEHKYDGTISVLPNIIKYRFEDIESIEQLDDFDNEYVYDIEVDDDSHTFIANDILVHNSVYTTYGTLFRAMTKESQKKFSTDEDKLNFIIKFNKEFLDKQNNKWCDEMYNPRHGHNIHEFELETVSKILIGLKKKKYIKAYVFVKGRTMLDNPKVAGTGIEIIKSTTPALCREILTEMMRSLMFDYDVDKRQEYILEFNNKLSDYRRKFYQAPIEDISQSVGVGEYSKYVIDDKNTLKFEKHVPVSVQAIARYNYLAHQNGQDNLIQYSGKIKYYNISIGKEIGFFGYPSGQLPQWAPPMNKGEQWKKTIIEPINRFLEVMDIPKVCAGQAQQMVLF